MFKKLLEVSSRQVRIVNFFKHSENSQLLFGGVIFVIIFCCAYQCIDPNLYQYRDDGVITFSVGKNIALYGFAGINPSGPIVEASSSPLQMLMYAATYKLFNIDYRHFSFWQTITSTFFLGVIFTRFFLKIRYTLMYVSIGGVLLTLFPPFILWHGSGMENALTHLLFLGSVCILYIADEKQYIDFRWIFVLFFTTIVRVDSVVFIGILLIFFSLYWRIQYQSFRAFNFSLCVFLLWLIFCILKGLYFYDFIPNTAYAQKISMVDNVKKLITLDQDYIKTSIFLSAIIFTVHGGLILALFVGIGKLLKEEVDNIFLRQLLGLCFLMVVLTPFVFGKARIDIWRTTTYVVPVVVLYLMLVLASLKTIKAKLIWGWLLFSIIIGAVLLGIIKPYYLGWSTKPFNKVRNEFVNIAQQENLYRATIANPDLGIMSWSKQFNIVDLGMLGSPLMAKLNNGPEVTDYFLHYALPDIIEAHGWWIELWCESIFIQKEFQDLYTPLAGTLHLQSCKDASQQSMHYWLRNDIALNSLSAERKLLNDLQLSLTVNRINQELSYCAKNGQSCRYVARTVYKFTPELRNLHIFDEVIALFSEPTDKALLEGWRNSAAQKVIIQAIKANTMTNT